MAETKNPQEWNISQTTVGSNVAQPTGNEWNVGQAATAPQQRDAQPTKQQWNLEADQWNVNQSVISQKEQHQETKEQREIKEQWNTSEPTPQLESSPALPSTQWDVAQPEPSLKTKDPAMQQLSVDQQPTQKVIPPERDEAPSTPSQNQTEKDISQNTSKVAELANEPEKQSMVTQPTIAREPPVTPDAKCTQQATDRQPYAAHKAVEQSVSTHEQEPIVPMVPPPASVPSSTIVTSQETVAKPISQTEPMVPPQPVVPKQPAAPPPVTATQPPPQPTPQHPNISQTSIVQSMATEQRAAPKQTVVQQMTPKRQPIQTRTAQSTTQVSMQPQISNQSPKQTASGTASQVSIPPEVKPKPSSADNQVRKGGDDGALEEIQKGVFWIGPELEGWTDKTKALKEEFRRQSIANEMYFVKNLPQLDVKALNISEEPSKYVFNVQDLKGVEVVNILRCVINEYREFEAGPFFFQFAEDKKFKLELLPTATQPGNGLIKSVGRLKYYTYPDMCQMLMTAGVTSKGLGIMLQKLNTSGLKSALNNKISPMNELHFMLLFEIARRLVRGPHGFSMSSEPEIDQLPIGLAVSRMTTMFCRGNYCLNYEAVFGAQDKYNPFVDTSVVLRRQKIYALNKLYYESEIRSQAGDNPFLAKFLKYHNGYIIKTVNGFMEELEMAFRGF